MTLVELMISLTLLSIVLSVFFTVLYSVQEVVMRSSDRSVANDDVRLAIEAIDREVRSGNVIDEPSSNGTRVRIYTQANAPTRRNGHRCVEWRVEAGLLQVRSWATDHQSTGDVTGWRTVAEDLVNDPVARPDEAPFTREQAEGTTFEGRLRVRFLVQPSTRSGRAVEIASTINGRNTQYGYSITPCDPAPAG